MDGEQENPKCRAKNGVLRLKGSAKMDFWFGWLSLLMNGKLESSKYRAKNGVLTQKGSTREQKMDSWFGWVSLNYKVQNAELKMKSLH